LRELFIPHEDLRDAWSPAKVLHHSTELAGIAKTGAPPPFLSPLSAQRLEQLAPVAQKLIQYL
ncbi:MAG TPA: dihydrodipicolinate synthase family protein, partial [Blastocatellia bacterium]|nr:dihydrodipicolinate synthase family protein [Blastocatellia bacterium]